MSKIDLTVNHNLTHEEAVKRIKGLLEKTKQEFADNIKDLQEKWNNNVGEFSFKANGFSVSGVLVVTRDKVMLVGDMPFLLGLFKGKITSVITEQANKLLA